MNFKDVIAYNMAEIAKIPNIIKKVKQTEYGYGFLNNTLIKFHTERALILRKEIKDCIELLQKDADKIEQMKQEGLI
jgi:hypothetical protein